MAKKFHSVVCKTVILLVSFVVSCSPVLEGDMKPTNQSSSDNGHATEITPTSIKTLMVSLTYLPTLDPQNACAELKNIFMGSDCKFPCWWGIEPGVTSTLAAENRLSTYYKIAPSDVVKDGLRLNLNVSILSQPDSMNVDAIRVDTEVSNNNERVYDEQVYSDLLGQYSLQSVFDNYGRPSDIFATVEISNAEPNAPDFLMIWLTYPEQGFVTKYTANAGLNNGIVTGCPTKSFIGLWLFHANNSEGYKRQLRQLDVDLVYIFPTLSERTKPISDAFGISVGEFYNLYKEPTNKCLETPYNIWPGW